jgi:two-component system, NarL family, response regulator
MTHTGHVDKPQRVRQQNGRIRVLTVDDHPIFRAGLAALVSNDQDLELVGEASSGREAVQQYLALRPDVTILDLQMPDGNGLEAIATIRANDPSARIIVLTTYTGDVRAERALKAGARGYLLKGMVYKQLLDCIRSVHAGQKQIQFEVLNELAEHLCDDRLTEREMQVLAQIAMGLSNRAVAKSLEISEMTVKGYLKTIFSKLGAASRTHAIMIAISRGYLE